MNVHYNNRELINKICDAFHENATKPNELYGMKLLLTDKQLEEIDIYFVVQYLTRQNYSSIVMDEGIMGKKETTLTVYKLT